MKARGGVSHRRGRPVVYDPDEGPEALLVRSGLTEEDAAEGGAASPVHQRQVLGVPRPPTHACGRRQASSAEHRAPCYRRSRATAGKATTAVPRIDVGRRVRVAGPYHPRRRLRLEARVDAVQARESNGRRSRRCGSGWGGWGATAGGDAGGAAALAERMGNEGVGLRRCRECVV
jgi:hypothetical protein